MFVVYVLCMFGICLVHIFSGFFRISADTSLIAGIKVAVIAGYVFDVSTVTDHLFFPVSPLCQKTG